jgi:predicted RND superfamily exporter protein/lauroyl/myristoyl acyltransferase
MVESGMKHPGRWLWLLLLVPIAVGLARLKFDVEVFDLLPDELPVVQGLKLYQQHFANARELLITLRAADAEQAESAARTLAERLRQRNNLVESVAWEPPWLEHPGQIGALLAYLWLNQLPEVFQQLTNRLAPNKLSQSIAALREQLATTLSPDEIGRLGYDPFGLTRLPEEISAAAPGLGASQGQEAFSSADGKFRVLYLKAARDLPTYRECDQWLKEIKHVPLPSGVSAGYTGRPAFVAEVANGMQHDVRISVGGTALIIAFLFWLAHRRLKPMFWLLTLLALILGSTLALGGLIFGSINVVSMGFAAILLGLAVDYAVVHYQEALAQPELSIPEIRAAIAPSIFWAAVTTICAFLVLNFGGLPGLGQLGMLVGLGVGLSACIMIFEFLPPLFPERRERKLRPETTEISEKAVPGQQRAVTGHQTWLVFIVSGTLLALAALVLLRGLPFVDPTANSLRPRHSQAYGALEEIKKELNQNREPLWLIVGGENETQVARRLVEVEKVLQRAVANSVVAGFTLPTALWPRPEFQAANLAGARQLAAERSDLRQAALANGFTESALGLTDQMLETWRQAGETTGVFWPSNQVVQWIFEKATARSATNQFALGLIQQATGSESEGRSEIQKLQSELPRQGVWLSGWELLGGAIFSRVKTNMWLVLTPMASLVLLSLGLAFKRPAEVLLSLGVLALSGLCLLTVMRLAGWSWNLLNLMAVPLVLGTGVDYSIFMQLALRRHRGDLSMAYRSVGRALLLCGGTACAGFGSLAFSTNAGMGSLGQVCAVGIGANMLISIFLLPTWWHVTRVRRAQDEQRTISEGRFGQLSNPDPRLSTPSSLYRSEFWRLGLWLVRILPTGLCLSLGRLIAACYWLLAGHRRETVINNVLPVCANDSVRAVKIGKTLIQQFALKLVDLWRYEAGLPIDDLLGEQTGWDHFVEAQSQKRGILLLSAHVGNWEFGVPWLARRGVVLQVITMPEPTQDFTKLRQASRQRWNVETLVIGEDPFAFLQVIKRLDQGATVALLVDRPPPSAAVTVELFGRPFRATIAAAELARASGCVLLPVCLPRNPVTYSAHVLPPIPYNRAALRDRQARQQLTQEIMSAFEPFIREHIDQWYHFVPIWPS